MHVLLQLNEEPKYAGVVIAKSKMYYLFVYNTSLHLSMTAADKLCSNFHANLHNNLHLYDHH